MTLFVGTSGWQYKDWKETFYPKSLPQGKWLEHYSGTFPTVEINNTFYRLPEPDVFQAWARKTPTDFVFAVKASRYITHIRRLKDTGDSISLFMERAGKLRRKLGAVLLQLPPNLKADIGSLEQTLERFRGKTRVVVEFRHQTWFSDEVKAVLTESGAALCLADKGSRPASPIWRTANWTYLRMHAGTASPPPCYGRSSLNSWVRRLSEQWGKDEDIYVYFNNDTRACAVRDAATFARIADKAGLNVQ